MAALVTDTTQKLVAFTRRGWRLLAGIAAALIAYGLLGFLLAPWLVKNAAIDAVDQNLNAELRLEKVFINPFVLSLHIDGLELDAADGEPIARVQHIFTNFQLSSLFRWAWSFAEIRFDGPELFLSRDDMGALNLVGLRREEDTPKPPPESDGERGIPRLYIFDFSVSDARVDWHDAVPAEPVKTVFGPVSVRIAELNTLPERAGEQEVLITTESQGTLSWAGSLQLNPLMSAGHAAIRGSHFPLTSAYIRHETGVDITDGEANIELDYSIFAEPDGQLRAAIDNLEVSFTGLRVNTFHAEPDDRKQPREFLSVPRISLTGGTLRWPERELAATNFEIGDAVLDLVRLEDGRFDFATRKPPDVPAAEEAEEPTDVDDSPWRIALDRFAIGNMDVGLSDLSVEPAADIGLNAITLEVFSISNDQAASFPTTLSMVGREGGTIRLDGSVIALPQPELDFELSVADLSLAAAHPYVKPLADVNLDAGTLGITGRMRHDATDPLLFTSDIVITDFLVTETDEGTRLGSWKELSAEGVELSVSENALEISEVRFDKLYGDILIAADGSVNLGRVSKTVAEESTEPADASDAESDTEDSGPAMGVTIGRVIIDDAAADFADESLPLPFVAKIEALNGSLSTISTGSAEPSNVELEGKVDEYGLVRVTGFVTPLDVTNNTDLSVVFENVEMPKFSAYTIPFAGREIASGKLDLDLGYEVKERKLAGENKIVLRDFELGDEVDHPGAMSLPLGLAVALLKDPSGKIDIDLPVRGDLDDPEFGYGRVIGKALVNLIVKIVASPFALLGNLVGAEPDELEYINFPPGRADLTPPEVERTEKLAEALALRPQLMLEISGVIDRKIDSLALKTARIDAAVELRIESESTGGEANYAAQRAQVIESMYRESINSEQAELVVTRAAYTAVEIDDETGKESEQFDQLAYTEELRRRLIDAEDVAEPELVALARQRAINTNESVLAASPGLDGRVLVVDLREEDTRSSDDSVRMKISLTTGSAGSR
jgi:uncharacterized protein involved in outer membrane biogenesis